MTNADQQSLYDQLVRDVQRAFDNYEEATEEKRKEAAQRRKPTADEKAAVDFGGITTADIDRAAEQLPQHIDGQMGRSLSVILKVLSNIMAEGRLDPDNAPTLGFIPHHVLKVVHEVQAQSATADTL